RITLVPLGDRFRHLQHPEQPRGLVREAEHLLERLVAAPVGQDDLDIIFEPELVDRPRRQVQPGLEPPGRPTQIVVVARTADEGENGTLRVRIGVLCSIWNVGHAPLPWISQLTGGPDRWRRLPAGRAPGCPLVVQEVDQPQGPLLWRFPRTRSSPKGARRAPLAPAARCR